MDGERSFLDDPANTREEIMRATYRALCEHGYADLTIQRIGEHFEKSKSLLYHHYDSKDELLLEFLAFMLEELEASMPEIDDDPRDHLETVLDRVFAADLTDDRREFESAMVELRAQAATDERFREQFTRHDSFFRQRLADVLRAGIEADQFRDVDPERVADYVNTVVEGVRCQRATSDAGDVGNVRAELDAYLEAVVYADE